jgi:hypothetical protein
MLKKNYLQILEFTKHVSTTIYKSPKKPTKSTEYHQYKWG